MMVLLSGGSKGPNPAMAPSSLAPSNENINIAY